MRSLLALRGFVLAVQIAILACGCIDDQRGATPPPPLPEIRDGGTSISVGVPPGIWQSAISKLDGNAIVFQGPVTFSEEKDGVSLVLSAGTKCSFATHKDGILLSFSDPYPVAKKSIGYAKVMSISLFPDGKGEVKTQHLGTWPLRWDDSKDQSTGSAGSACACGCSKPDCRCSTDAPQAAASKPSTRRAEYYTASWCGPCRTFGPNLKRLADKHKLNIRTIDVDQNPAVWQPHALKDNQIPQLVIYEGDTEIDVLVLPTDEQILQAMGVKK